MLPTWSNLLSSSLRTAVYSLKKSTVESVEETFDALVKITPLKQVQLSFDYSGDRLLQPFYPLRGSHYIGKADTEPIVYHDHLAVAACHPLLASGRRRQAVAVCVGRVVAGAVFPGDAEAGPRLARAVARTPARCRASGPTRRSSTESSRQNSWTTGPVSLHVWEESSALCVSPY